MKIINIGISENRNVFHFSLNPLSAQFLFLKDTGCIHCIEKTTITYLKAQGNYTMVYTTERKFLSSKTLKHFEGLLKSKVFIRVHQFFLVNVRHVTQFRYDSRSELVLLTGATIPVSRKRKSIVVRAFQNLK